MRDRDKGAAGGLEPVHQPGKVCKRARQPIDFVDNNHVDPAAIDIGKQALQCRTFQGAAREAAIVIAGGQHLPALMALTGNVGRAGLMLGIERVEALIETLVG